MKFKVKSGCHREGKKVYSPGDIVDADRDLEKAFKNKFERVVEEAPPPPANVDIKVDTLPAEEKKVEVRTIRRFKGSSPNIQV